ncbi:MAG: M36 family metallopeptidase [Exilibacterium sp.]
MHHNNSFTIFSGNNSFIPSVIKKLPLAIALAGVSTTGWAATEQGKSSITSPSLIVPGNLVNTIGGKRTSEAVQGRAAVQDLQLSIKQSAKAEFLKAVPRSGMQHQYDPKLGKATFIWGSGNDKPAGSQVIAASKRGEWAANQYFKKLTGLDVATDELQTSARAGSATNRSDVKQSANQGYLVNLHDQGKGPLVAKYRQRIQGVEVFNRELNIMLDRDMNMVASAGYLVEQSEISKQVDLFSFGRAAKAVEMAFAEMGGDNSSITLQKDKKRGDWQYYTVGNSSDKLILVGEPRVKQVIYDQKGKLQAAYYVEVQTSIPDAVDGDYFAFVIAPESQQVLLRHNLKSHAEFTYRVYADPETKFPFDGPHGDVTPGKSPDQVDPTEILEAELVTLESGPISTGDPWLPEGALDTLGNNVVAYADVVAPQGFTTGDFSAPITTAGTFDYPLDVNETSFSISNRHAAIVNLFYMNNFLHDWFYDHGFDEASGNAQISNYGRGGEENDPLLVEAQDNSGFNNANMSTPADGAPPRMQMYLFDSKDAVSGEDYGVFINNDGEFTFLTSSQTASFGPLRFNELSGTAVRINDGDTGEDGSGTETDGCETLQNPEDIAGKIAIIDRGACNFTVKVLNAQEAGAIAALVVNNQPGDEPSPMGGDDENVNIPSMGLSNNDGKQIIDALAEGQSVALKMFNQRAFKDGTFDNGIIAHEWGHYISNRLIGNGSGLINNQGGAMGEGWGDFHSLLLLVREADQALPGNDLFQAPYPTSTFVENFYTGVRRIPYSTNTDLNPLTFKHIENGVELPDGLDSSNNSEVHNSGEVWATMLWECYAALINSHGFVEAQDRMMDYLVAGYKLTPIAPTYTEARDALLAAAYASDANDYQLMLAAFASRGMGLGAVSPDRFSDDHAGVVESYETSLPAVQINNASLTISPEGTVDDTILQVGETGRVTLSIKNVGSIDLTSVKAQVSVLSGQEITFANDGILTFEKVALFDSATGQLDFTLDSSGVAETMVLQVSFPPQEVDSQALVVPEPVVLVEPVNYRLLDKAPVADRSEDNLDTLAAPFDWQENALLEGSEDVRAFLPTSTPFGADTTLVDLGFDEDSEVMYIPDRAVSTDVAYETRAFI